MYKAIISVEWWEQKEHYLYKNDNNDNLVCLDFLHLDTIWPIL